MSISTSHSDPLQTPRHLAICIRDPRNDLVSAECRHLTGHEPDQSGHAYCDALENIPDAAYVRCGARAIVQTTTLDALIGWLLQVRFRAADFRLELIDRSNEGLPSKRLVTIAVANAIDGRPNLDHPQHRFLLVVADQALWFGEIVAEPARTYRRHEAKPYRTAGSLPARLARALVNLVAPDATSIVNPCCGTGSILLEACVLGLRAYGADWNPRMAGMSRRNLAHFDYFAPVELIDARDWNQTADALIADLPYGTAHPLDETTVSELLQSAASLAPVAVFVAGKDISARLQRSGFRDVELFRVHKAKGFTRYVHRAQSVARATNHNTERPR